MKDTAKQVVLSAMIGALLLGGQITISFIPNVEIVTLVIVVSAFVFSPRVSLAAVLVFCTGEWLIYGFGYWVIAYYIYWPFLAVISLSLKLIKKNWLRNIAAIIIVLICTTFFGVLTSVIDALFTSSDIDFLTAFTIIYLRGIYFYITHIVSNCIIIGLLFTPLSVALKRPIKSNKSTL